MDAQSANDVRTTKFVALANSAIQRKTAGLFTLLTLVVTILTCSAQSVIAQGLAAGKYEISVTWGSASQAVTTSYEVLPGETIRVSLGDETQKLGILPIGDSDFDLQASVTREVPNAPVLEADSVRQGSFGVPIDVRDSNRDTTFPSGVFVTVRQLL